MMIYDKYDNTYIKIYMITMRWKTSLSTLAAGPTPVGPTAASSPLHGYDDNVR